LSARPLFRNESTEASHAVHVQYRTQFHRTITFCLPIANSPVDKFFSQRQINMPPLYVVLHDPEFSANEESWLIKELVPTPSITLLASPPKAGKTVFATALAVAVATGQPFLGHEVAQGPVLWIAGDETRAERRRVLDQIPYPDGPYPIPAAVENHSPGPRAIPLYTCYSGLNITGDFFRQEVSDLCRMLQPKLLVLDPLLTMIARQDLSRDHQARQALEALRNLSKEFELAIFALHHARNAQRCANYLPVETASNSVWMLDRAENRVRLDRRGRGDFANGTTFATSPQLGVYHLDPRAAFAPTGITTEDLVLEVLDHEPRTARDIARDTELNLSTVRNTLTHLRNRGQAIQTGRVGKQMTYQRKAPNSFY